MQTDRNAVPDQTRQQSLSLLNLQLAAAAQLQDQMHHSSRNRLGANFIMIDDLCAQVSSVMEVCSTLISARMADLGQTAPWPAPPKPMLLDGSGPAEPLRDTGLRVFQPSGPMVMASIELAPLDAFGQSVLDAVTEAQAYGDMATAEVMTAVWRCVDRQLWAVTITSGEVR